jgi:hypothetical protein
MSAVGTAIRSLYIKNGIITPSTEPEEPEEPKPAKTKCWGFRGQRKLWRQSSTSLTRA